MPRHVSYPAAVEAAIDAVLTRLFGDMTPPAPTVSILSVTSADLDQLPPLVASAVRAEMVSAGYDPATVTVVKFSGGRVDEVTVTVADEPKPDVTPAPVDVVVPVEPPLEEPITK